MCEKVCSNRKVCVWRTEKKGGTNSSKLLWSLMQSSFEMLLIIDYYLLDGHNNLAVTSHCDRWIN